MNNGQANFVKYLHNSGAPRQAAIAILGKPFLAIDKLEMKSSRQLPQARIVIPIEISDRLNATPIDCVVEADRERVLVGFNQTLFIKKYRLL